MSSGSAALTSTPPLRSAFAHSSPCLLPAEGKELELGGAEPAAPDWTLGGQPGQLGQLGQPGPPTSRPLL